MRRLALCLALVAACGGRAAQPSEVTAAGGVLGADDAPAAGQGGSESGSAAAVDESGAPGAGAESRPDAPFIPSGTRDCENDRYCFDLRCYTPRSNLRGACLSECEGDSQCQPGEHCARTDELEGACYQLCDSPVDCEYGFDCVDVENERASFVCFPSKWAPALWPR